MCVCIESRVTSSVWVCVCVYIHTHTHTHTHIYIYIYIYIYTHTYIAFEKDTAKHYVAVSYVFLNDNNNVKMFTAKL